MTILTLQPDATAGKDGRTNGASPTTEYSTAASVNVDQSSPSRMLLQFDLSSIPAGSTINSATLYLYNLNLRTGDRPFAAYRILQDWEEACTWNLAKPSTSTPWLGDTGADGGADAGCSVAGTDHNSTAMGSWTYLANTAANTEHQVALDTSEVAAWLTANYGMVLRMTTVLSAITWATSDNTTATYRPRLVIDYTAAGEPISGVGDIQPAALTVSGAGALLITGQGAPSLAQLAASGFAVVGEIVTWTDGTGGDANTIEDNLLNSAAPNHNLGAHANHELSNLQNSLFRVDLSALPAGSTVISAVLRLKKSYPTGEGGGTVAVSIYSVAAANAAWQPGTRDLELALAGESCWNALASDGASGVQTAWAGGSNGCGVSGTDYEAALLGSLSWTPLDDPIGQVYEIALDPERVEGWFGASNTNYGLLLKTAAGGSDHVGQRDSLTAAYRPEFEVQYVAPLTEITGSGAITLGALSASGEGGVLIEGEASLSLDAIGASGAGTVMIIGQAALALDALSMQSGGAVLLEGAAEIALDALTAQGAGVVGTPPILGQAALMFDPMTGSGEGFVLIEGAASVALSALLAGGAARALVRGTGALLLGSLSVISSGYIGEQNPALVAVTLSLAESEATTLELSESLLISLTLVESSISVNIVEE